MKTLGLLILFFCLPALAKTDHPMESAKVISQDISSRDGGVAMMPLGNGVVGVPITRRSNVVVVETADQRLTWAEVGKTAVILPVNGVVRFYRDGQWFVVLDSKDKKHKFSLVHLEALK